MARPVRPAKSEQDIQAIALRALDPLEKPGATDLVRLLLHWLEKNVEWSSFS